MEDNAPIELSLHPVTLEILAREEDWLGTFDQVEVWRSRGTADGPYAELTAQDWLQARIPMDASDQGATPVDPPVYVTGKQLDVISRERDVVSVVFSGADPLQLSTVAAQITAAGRRLVQAYVDPNGNLVLESVGYGATSTIRALPGDGATVLGLPTTLPDSQGFGRDARLALTQGREVYSFVDSFGDVSFWYRFRLRNRTTGVVSEFTAPFQVGAGTAVETSNVILGELDLMDLEGSPLVGRDVRIARDYPPQLVSGVVVAAREELKYTDQFGHVEFILLRGQPITLAIAGTDMVVKVTPPTDQSVAKFNLLDTTYITQDDYFTTRVANLPFAARRSL